MGVGRSGLATATPKVEPPDPHDCLPQVDRETSSLADKEAALEMEFQLEVMRLKLLASEGDNLAKLLRRDDSSGFEYAYDGVQLPLDDDGFVQSFSVHETDAIRNFFEQYGLVVVEGAIDGAACDRSVAELWDFLERECRNLDRTDPSTWERWPSLSKLGILGNTFLLSPQFCENRQSPGVHRGFAAVFGTEKLVVNTGRASAMRPTRRVPLHETDGEVPLVDRPEWKSVDGAEWLHWDMNPFNGFASTFSWRTRDVYANHGYGKLRVQGILALSDCGPDDGGFFCVPGSHRVIQGWANRNGEAVRDAQLQSPESNTQLRLPPDDPLKLHAQKAPIRRGSLLIWDARVAHCNFPNDSENMRIVQYIQMVKADDPAMGPLCTKESYLPPVGQFELSEVGSKLYGFTKW